MEPQPSLVSILARAVRRLPVTSVFLMTSCLLFAVSTLSPWLFPQLDTRFPGALSTRTLADWPEVSGHFELWRGDWWRLLLGTFHHDGFLHLSGNAVVLWLLADLLEPRLGRIRFLIFCLASALFSAVPEALLGNDSVGLSGMIFAMFGLLIVMRHHDDELAKRISDPFILWGFGWLLACVVLTQFEILAIANAAHFGGLIYGCATGWVCFEAVRRFRPVVPLLLVSVNAVPLILLIAAMHPIWNGRYFAWRGFQFDRRADWERATELDPSIGVAWMRLIELDVERGDTVAAWEKGLKALRLNRGDEQLEEKVTAIWNAFQSVPQRATALTAARKAFGDESDAWLARLQLPVSRPRSPLISTFAFFDMPPEPPVNLHALINLPETLAGVTSPFPPDLAPGDVDPEHPDSARLGLSL